MKVYLNKDIEKVGMAGEIIKVTDGYARNFLLPRKLGVEITEHNEAFYKTVIKQVENRKEVINSKTSMLAERIKAIKLTMKRKMHDDGKLYGSVNQQEVADLLIAEGINAQKSQIIFENVIKSKGTFDVAIKLTSRLKPVFSLTIVSE